VRHHLDSLPTSSNNQLAHAHQAPDRRQPLAWINGPTMKTISQVTTKTPAMIQNPAVQHLRHHPPRTPGKAPDLRGPILRRLIVRRHDPQVPKPACSAHRWYNKHHPKAVVALAHPQHQAKMVPMARATARFSHISTHQGHRLRIPQQQCWLRPLLSWRPSAAAYQA
jgi:hypothetical protein